MHPPTQMAKMHQVKNIQTYAIIFWMKASWFNEHICNRGSLPFFCVVKDFVITRGPGTEIKRNHQLLFSSFSLSMTSKKYSKRIHDDKYTVSDQCFILKLSPVWWFQGCWDLMQLAYIHIAVITQKVVNFQIVSMMKEFWR